MSDEERSELEAHREAGRNEGRLEAGKAWRAMADRVAPGNYVTDADAIAAVEAKLKELKDAAAPRGCPCRWWRRLGLTRA